MFKCEKCKDFHVFKVPRIVKSSTSIANKWYYGYGFIFNWMYMYMNTYMFVCTCICIEICRGEQRNRRETIVLLSKRPCKIKNRKQNKTKTRELKDKKIIL